jgi:ubiquinone/menaquinone biosynthesis C-methylase UbiE
MIELPPEEMIFPKGDFVKIGQDFLVHFVKLGHLKPNERVLDVGSGIGRMAIPLTKFLTEEGCYEGFDIVAKGVEWCTQNITQRYPRFRFQLADIYNKQYNPTGREIASSYRFPYDEATFDFAFLTSVFTHMLPQDMENYLSEIARVLKNDGRCLITYFLLNDESLNLTCSGRGNPVFKFDRGTYRIANEDTPEAATAYREDYILSLYAKYGLMMSPPIQYGSWCGRERFLSYQDITVAIKR